MLAVVFGIFAGALMPIQTSVNNRLRLSVGAPLLASFFSFLIGTCALLVATWLSSGRPLPNFSAASGEPMWIFTGGLLGVVVLTGNILLFPRVGSVQTVILPITGQILMGLLIDTFGLFDSPTTALGVWRIIGAIAVLCGALAVVGVFNRSRSSSSGSINTGPGVWLWRALGIVMGACAATQISVNGRLGVVLGSPVEAALVSFAVGTTALFILLLLTRTTWNGIAKLEGGNPWWMWVGGLLGATLIFATASLGPILGTGMTVVAMLLGMMAASLLIDACGLLGALKRRIVWTQIMGLAVIVAGVALIRLV